ncbi:MAG TPA: hypothetical protein V6D09_17085 [Leptolyngbyaceae cyanobacterium]
MITNRDRFPDVNFLEPNDFKIIGDVEGTPLVLIGREQGSDALVVSRTHTDDPKTENLFAVPLYELLSHTFGAVNIAKNI